MLISPSFKFFYKSSCLLYNAFNFPTQRNVSGWREYPPFPLCFVKIFHKSCNSRCSANKCFRHKYFGWISQIRILFKLKFLIKNSKRIIFFKRHINHLLLFFSIYTRAIKIKFSLQPKLRVPRNQLLILKFRHSSFFLNQLG